MARIYSAALGICITLALVAACVAQGSWTRGLSNNQNLATSPFSIDWSYVQVKQEPQGSTDGKIVPYASMATTDNTRCITYIDSSSSTTTPSTVACTGTNEWSVLSEDVIDGPISIVPSLNVVFVGGPKLYGFALDSGDQIFTYDEPTYVSVLDRTATTDDFGVVVFVTSQGRVVALDADLKSLSETLISTDEEGAWVSPYGRDIALSTDLNTLVVSLSIVPEDTTVALNPNYDVSQTFAVLLSLDGGESLKRGVANQCDDLDFGDTPSVWCTSLDEYHCFAPVLVPSAEDAADTAIFSCFIPKYNWNNATETVDTVFAIEASGTPSDEWAWTVSLPSFVTSYVGVSADMTTLYAHTQTTYSGRNGVFTIISAADGTVIRNDQSFISSSFKPAAISVSSNNVVFLDEVAVRPKGEDNSFQLYQTFLGTSCYIGSEDSLYPWQPTIYLDDNVASRLTPSNGNCYEPLVIQTFSSVASPYVATEVWQGVNGDQQSTSSSDSSSAISKMNQYYPTVSHTSYLFCSRDEVECVPYQPFGMTSSKVVDIYSVDQYYEMYTTGNIQWGNYLDSKRLYPPTLSSLGDRWQNTESTVYVDFAATRYTHTLVALNASEEQFIMPVVVGNNGYVYAISADMNWPSSPLDYLVTKIHVTAFLASSGVQVWRTTLDSVMWSMKSALIRPTLSDDNTMLFFNAIAATKDTFGYRYKPMVVAISDITKSTAPTVTWTSEISQCYSSSNRKYQNFRDFELNSPVFSNGKVYVNCYSSNNARALAARNATDGSSSWTVGLFPSYSDCRNPGIAISQNGGMVIHSYNTADGSAMAVVNADTGDVVHAETFLDQISQGSVVAIDGNNIAFVYVMTLNDVYLSAFNVSNVDLSATTPSSDTRLLWTENILHSDFMITEQIGTLAIVEEGLRVTFGRNLMRFEPDQDQPIVVDGGDTSVTTDSTITENSGDNSEDDDCSKTWLWIVLTLVAIYAIAATAGLIGGGLYVFKATRQSYDTIA